MVRRKYHYACEYGYSHKVVYDDIVDKTDFRRKTYEEERNERLRNQLGNSGSFEGQYDYEDGKITDANTPSAFAVALRENRLDRAEIDEYQRELKRQYENASSEIERKEIAEKVKALSDARQEAIDSLLGINQEETQKE